MAKFGIRTFGDPVLRKRAKEIPQINDSIRQLAEDMFETLEEAEGVGLAAPQIGISLRLIVLSVPEGERRRKMALVNPEKVREEGENICDEGCLSIPGVTEQMKRAEEVEIRAKDLEGKAVTVKANGILSRALQHEIDHLDGVLFIDRLSIVRRQLLRKQLEELVAKTKDAMGTCD